MVYWQHVIVALTHASLRPDASTLCCCSVVSWHCSGGVLLCCVLAASCCGAWHGIFVWLFGGTGGPGDSQIELNWCGGSGDGGMVIGDGGNKGSCSKTASCCGAQHGIFVWLFGWHGQSWGQLNQCGGGRGSVASSSSWPFLHVKLLYKLVLRLLRVGWGPPDYWGSLPP